MSRLAPWLRNWVGNRSGRFELNRLGQQELRNVAHDAGVSSGELRALAGKWPDSADLLKRRMSALHIDPVELAKNEPAVSRDLNKLCSLCADKRQCKRDLDAGSVNSRWRRYCPNTSTLMALLHPREREAHTGNGRQP